MQVLLLAGGLFVIASILASLVVWGLRRPATHENDPDPVTPASPARSSSASSLDPVDVSTPAVDGVPIDSLELQDASVAIASAIDAPFTPPPPMMGTVAPSFPLPVPPLPLAGDVEDTSSVAPFDDSPEQTIPVSHSAIRVFN